MDQKRKEIIIKEIKYWREYKLLPEHYCNFLLTLYTEGSNESDNSENESSKSTKRSMSISFKKLMFQSFMFFIIAQLPITFVVIYFTELSIVLQIALFTFFVVTSIAAGFLLYNKNNIFYHLPVINSGLILFLSSVQFVSNALMSNSIAMFIIILFNCGIWVTAGLKLKLNYFTISGSVGAVILVLYYFV